MDAVCIQRATSSVSPLSYDNVETEGKCTSTVRYKRILGARGKRLHGENTVAQEVGTFVTYEAVELALVLGLNHAGVTL